jgi:hypothetical protein
MELTVFILSAFVTVLGDTVLFKDTPKPVLLLLCIVPNFLCSIIYCTDAGLYFLDVIDFYINFVMIMIGFFESFGAAWAYGIPEMLDNIGMFATIAYMIGNFLPVFLACGVWFWVDNGDEVWIGFLVLFGGWFGGFLYTNQLLKQRMAEEEERWTWSSIWWECAFGNIGRLRERIQPVIGRIPFIWVVLIKNFIPHILIILFFNLCTSGNGAGAYGGYAVAPYQLLGMLTSTFAIFLVFLGLLVPEVYESFFAPQIKEIFQEETRKSSGVPSHIPEEYSQANS